MMLLVIVMAFAACKEKEDVATSLAEPTDIAASGKTISWNAVEGASKYEVIVQEKDPVETEDTFYTLNVTATGKYPIKIRAVGVNANGTTIYSKYVDYTFVNAKQLDTPILSLNDKTIAWSAVENASSYSITVIDKYTSKAYEGTQTELTFSMDNEKFRETGKYTVQVKAIPAEEQDIYVESEIGSKTYIVTEKLATPTISSVGSSAIIWTKVANASSYVLYLYDLDTSTLVDEYIADSYTYTFSSMDLENNHNYYCVVKAIGDHEVYLDSEVGTRNPEYDLHLIDGIDASSISFDKSTGKTIMSFDVKNVEYLSDYVVKLKVSTADSTASLKTQEYDIKAKDGQLTYTLYDGEYVSNLVLYDKRSAGTYKNTEDYNSKYTYYTFNGATYTEVTSSNLDDNIEYFIQFSGDNYIKARGEKTYVLAQASTFSTKKEYYLKEGNVYTLLTSKYVEYGNYASLDDDDTTTIYLKKGSGDTYTLLGTKAAIQEGDRSEEHYYVYVPFTSLPDSGEVYEAVYADISASEYSANTYYTCSAHYDFTVDEMFITYDTLLNPTHRLEEKFYGKTYSISITTNAIHTNYLPGSTISLDETFTSYRIPTKVSTSVEWADSAIKNYFETEVEYTAFATKYNDYYVVESLGDLQYASIKSDANFVQIRDIDFGSYAWNPIANFTGIFDGNNKVISNVVYANKANTGLFATTTGATLKNIFILGASNVAAPKAQIGGIVGYADTTTIENCYVDVSFKNVKYAGGIAAKATESTISNCQTDITATSINSAAGIVYDADDVDILRCISTGSITISDAYVSIGDYDALNANAYNLVDLDKIYRKDDTNYILLDTYNHRDQDVFKQDGSYYDEYFYRIVSNGDVVVGGIVSDFASTTTNDITACVADVEIKVTTKHVNAIAGGLAGSASSAIITKSYSGNKYTTNYPYRMEMVVNGESTCAGGLVGFIDETTIEDCHSNIRVSAKDYFAGFVGASEHTNVINRCYSTGGVSNQDAEHAKDLFIAAASDDLTANACYVYCPTPTSESVTKAEKASTFDAIMTGINENKAGSLTSIEGFYEPCETGVVFASEYVDKGKIGHDVKIRPYYAVYENDAFVVVNMYTNGERTDLSEAGDYTVKGTSFIILQEKTNDNSGLIFVIKVVSSNDN